MLSPTKHAKTNLFSRSAQPKFEKPNFHNHGGSVCSSSVHENYTVMYMNLASISCTSIKEWDPKALNLLCANLRCLQSQITQSPLEA